MSSRGAHVLCPKGCQTQTWAFWERLLVQVSTVENLFQIVSKQMMLLLALFFNDRFRCATKRCWITKSASFEELP